MIDINLVRSDPEKVRKNLERRKKQEKLKLFDELVAVDLQWRKSLQEIESNKAKRNQLSKDVETLKKSGNDFPAKIKEAQEVSQTIKELESQVNSFKEKEDSLLLRIPNLLHDSVPYGKDDSANLIVKKTGKIIKPAFSLAHHGELALALNQADFERAVKISSAGFFALKNDLLLLDFALQRFALEFLSQKGFQLIQPPFLMSKKFYMGVTDLAFFEEQLYKTTDDLYLIATSEHPLAAMYSDEIFAEKELPLKLAGISPCFRKEIGKHGLDERGFFRVHQFNKIEQFIFCTEEQSWKLFEELASNSEALLEKLKIPYERVIVCTGDIGDIATKKYDINGWSPREEKYIELMSCSNCSDYQSRNLKIKYRKGEEKKYVHTLNNTMVATTRFLRILIENYQTKEGTIKVPDVLQPYMGGLKEIVKK